MEGSEGNTEGKAEIFLSSSRICRFCLSPGGVMSPIFEQGELSSLPLSSKIMAFISIQVYVNDGLPSLICHRCLYQVEKSYDFKTQCEASDAMLRKYLSAVNSSTVPSRGSIKQENSDGIPTFDSFNLVQFQKSMLHNSTFSDSPFKRKRGRPRKEENLIFYSSPVRPQQLEAANGISSYPDDEIKFVDGIESVVTIVDPRSEILSNSDEENKVENESEEKVGDEKPSQNDDETLNSLAIAKAKAKKYMGVVIAVDENGTRNRRHLCKGCGKTFGHCSDLRKHVLVHTGERPFHCRLCTKTFSRSTNLNKHMKVHTGQKPFFCTDCPKSFATKGDLQRHLIIHSGIKPFSCHLCSQCFSRKDKLTRHLKLHEGSGLGKMNFKCGNCPVVYHSKVDLKQHVESVHGKDEDEEDVTSNSEEPFVDDVVIKEESSSNDVKEEKDFAPEDDVSEQEVESMVINIDPFQMDSDLNDPSMASWENEKTKEAEDRFQKNPDYRETEEASSALVKDKHSHQCKICHKKFNESTYLRSHMATHSLLKPHKCSTCEKSFTRRRELLRHENVHTGVKPFECVVCSKAFSRKDKLARHHKIHNNGLKKFSCCICPNLAFSKVEQLVAHRSALHSDEERREEEEEGAAPAPPPPPLSNGFGCDSEEFDSEDEKYADDSLQQLTANPAITVTSLSKSNR